MGFHPIGYFLQRGEFRIVDRPVFSKRQPQSEASVAAMTGYVNQQIN
jgi:hypothetical protein